MNGFSKHHNGAPIPNNDTDRYGFMTSASGFIPRWEKEVAEGVIKPTEIIARLNYEARIQRRKEAAR